MRERVERYAKDAVRAGSGGPGRNGHSESKELQEEGELRGLWENVKSAGRREAIVLCVLDDGEFAAEQKEGKGVVKDSGHYPITRTKVVVPRFSRHARLLARLEAQITKISARRDELKAEEEIVAWREAVVSYAARRADRKGECGWDGRLLWSEDEVRDFGTDVVDMYERVESKLESSERGEEEGMAVDGVEGASEEGEWWCAGKKKCDRHSGYAFPDISYSWWLLTALCPDGRSCVKLKLTLTESCSRLSLRNSLRVNAKSGGASRTYTLHTPTWILTHIKSLSLAL
jgi:COMPASS component SPP1